jgi:hypothetical protein
LTITQQILAGAAQLCLLACFVGLLRSGRWRECISFFVYIVAVLVFGSLQTWIPSKFNNWPYYLAKQSIYEGIKLSLALELAYRVFRYFPGAKVTAERWVLLVLVGSIVGLQTLSGQGRIFVLNVHSHVSLCTLWIFGVTWMLVWRYAILLHPTHRGLLSSFAPYLALFAGLSHLLALIGKEFRPYFAHIDQPAYLLLAAWFAVLAWRRGSDNGYEKVTSALQLRTA